MTDSRPICAKCNESMVSERNGVTVKYSHDGFQKGDLYRCKWCGAEIITGFGNVFHNWGHDKDGKYFKYEQPYQYTRGNQ